jgi:thioredoxin 1
MAAVADAIAQELPGRIKVVTANVFEAQDAAQRHGVMRVPCFLVIKAGKVAAQLSGVRSREELLDALAPVLE